ncbi:hypothetical protein LRAMOSA11094 [Lichtheimia ramosa]|uniref:Heterokaryon incompatibility domain-containing protein n=1 Tax=Lichtheimia ramosa TaxID=688394 RepID=A0A077WUA9_9FUNG|nr:hypothetical protein LRAMOSA11094 [Lichtheimia ramosa]
MTCNTDDDNDAFKINIDLDDDRDYRRKRFFEKGLSALLADEHFLVLYVPENGGKMQIIRPAGDPYHHKRIIKRINEAKGVPSFYYALSHVWGLTETNRYLWNEIGEYVDDEGGKPAAPVSMRPEKRDTLLSMLKDHPDSYWWIDVLCARTDTPLDIMGDIYACCLECVAMIDCDPSVIPQLNTMTGVREHYFESVYLSRDDPFVKQLYDEKLPQVMDVLSKLMQCSWWTRVWTWQEMALPFGEVRLMAETGTHRPLSNTITLHDLCDKFQHVVVVMDNEKYQAGSELRRWFQEIRFANEYLERSKDRVEVDFFYLIRTLGNSTRRCMDPADYVYGVLGIFQIKIPRMSDPSAVWQLFLSKFDDYMVKMKNKQVGLEGTITGISERARQVNLLKAKDMRDVYANLLEMVR